MKKIGVGAVAAAVLFGFPAVCSAAMLEVNNNVTWTDLSALDGYDGVTIASGRTLTLAPASGTMVFDKIIAGDGGIVKDGAGDLELRGDNTFNGTCIIGGTGNVYAYSNTAFGSATGRTKVYEGLYTAGATVAKQPGAALYLCGITTDEGFDIITDDVKRGLYIQANTDNTVNGSVTMTGSQADIYALAGATVRFRGGISGTGTLRPSTKTGAKIIIEEKPLACTMWNSQEGAGLFLLAAPSNKCSYTWQTITLGCDWAFDGVGVNWETGGTHMKIDLNGYANRVSSIALTKADMNGWVTSTGGKAYLYNTVASDTTTYLPFRGKAGLFKEGAGTLTIAKNTKNASDTTGELCVTNGEVAFDAEAAWPNVRAVTLEKKGRLTLTADGQIGSTACLYLSDDALLTLPENGELTVTALNLNGAWLAAGDHAVSGLGGRVAGEGATVHVLSQPPSDTVNVLEDEVWDDARLAALESGVWICAGATLTMSNAAPYELTVPVSGAGTLVIDGNARFDLSNASPAFDGDLHLRGFGKRPLYLNNSESFGTAAGSTTFHVSYLDTSDKDGTEFWFNGITTDDTVAFKGNNSPCRIHAVSGTVNTFNGDASCSGSQVSFMPEANAQFVFNKSFSGSGCSPSPKGGAQIVFNCPCTAGLFNSHEPGGDAVFNATGNAPLGYFCCTAKFGVDFAWDNVDAVLGMKYYSNVKVDLSGHPQRVTSLYHYDSSRSLANCTYVTDTSLAKTFLYVNTTANGDSRVYFQGRAGLYWENTGTVTFKETTSTSCGDLTVAKGRVVFDTATWLTGDTVTVKAGAVLEIKDATKFGFNHIVLEDGGKIVMPSGTLHACDVTLGETAYPAGSTLTMAEHPEYFETTDGTLACDGDYVINVIGANVGTVEEVALDVPAGKRRIVKTGGGTAYVKAGVNLSPTAQIVIKAGALGILSPDDVSVLLSASTPSVAVEDGGTLDLSGLNASDVKTALNAVIVSIAGAGATAADGVSKVGALWRWKRLGDESSSGGNTIFANLVLTADATVNADGLDYGCTGGGTKLMNGHTLTKIGANQFYWGNRTTPGNFIVKTGNFNLFNNPEMEGTAENFIRVEGVGQLMFNNCTAAMKPVPHSLDWRSSLNFAAYNDVGRWAGPWLVSSNLTVATGTSGADSRRGRLIQEGPVVSTNRGITVNASYPTLELSGPNRHELGSVFVSGQMELRDGATAELHPFPSGDKTEVTLSQSATSSYGVPATLTISNAVLASAPAVTPAKNVYGDFVLAWTENMTGALVLQDGAVVTGSLFCAQGGLGIVRQSGGEFVARDQSGKNNANFFAGTGTAYGGLLLSGGRFVSDAALNAASASGATAIIRQDGGEFVSGVNGKESFSAGGGYFSFLQTGGTFTNDSAISFGYYASAAGARRELGIRGSATRQYHYWDIRVGRNSADADTMVYHLADGATLDLRCFNYQRPDSATGRRFYMGSDGGVLHPHQGDVFAGLPPDAFTLYKGGLVVDTTDAAVDPVAFSAALRKPAGKVVTGVTLPTDDAYLAEQNFLGPAKLTISGGSGAAATAVTVYDAATRTLSGVEIVSPGFGYQAGDAVTATVEGQFKKTSYPCAVTLGDPDLTGGLTKRGAKRLKMTGENDYNGVTRIEGGTLEFTAGSYPANSDVEITAEAVRAAQLSGTPALIVYGFPNGRTVTLLGADTLDLSGLAKAVKLVRFDGTRPTSVNLRVLDSAGQPYVLPDGNRLYFSGGAIRVGKQLGMLLFVR